MHARGWLVVQSLLLEIAAVEACSVVGALQGRAELLIFLCDPVLKVVHKVACVGGSRSRSRREDGGKTTRTAATTTAAAAAILHFGWVRMVVSACANSITKSSNSMLMCGVCESLVYFMV